jgi:FCD domain-containing protein
VCSGSAPRVGGRGTHPPEQEPQLGQVVGGDARVWRGLLGADAAAQTLAEHQAIYDALAAGDPELSRAAALLHVSSPARWLRHTLAEGAGSPVADLGR